MIEQEKKEFAAAVTEVLKSYNQEAGKITLRIWWTALEKHDLNTVLNALGSYCAHPDKCRFAPKAGDIVGMIEGTTSDRAALASAAFARLMSNTSRYETVVFSDPAIHYGVAVAFGNNWQSACDFDSSIFECQQQKRDFEKAYASYKVGMTYPARLIGIHEITNNKDGNEYQDVKYIGLKAECLAVENGAVGSGMKRLDLKAGNEIEISGGEG